jgi:hypothetical protein
MRGKGRGEVFMFLEKGEMKSPTRFPKRYNEAVHGQAMVCQRACLMQLSGVIGGEKRLGS